MFGLKKIFGRAVDYKALCHSGAIILDVRTAGEFMAGHIPGSINLPLQQLESAAAELARANRTVITCCRSGYRSEEAAQLLRRKGIEAYNAGSWNGLLKLIG